MNNPQWQSVTTRPATHHALKITEEVKGTTMKGTSVYHFPLGETIFVTGKTDTLRVGDWIVKTEKGLEFFSADEFRKTYMENS